MALLYYIRQDYEYDGVSNILGYFRIKEKAEDALKAYRLTADNPQNYELDSLRECDLGDSDALFIYHESWQVQLSGIERNELVNVRWVYSLLTAELVELQIPGVTCSAKSQAITLEDHWETYFKAPPYDGYGAYGVWYNLKEQVLKEGLWNNSEKVIQVFTIAELPEWSQVKKKLQVENHGSQ